jgi:Putative beta barrel porin-7 (BBP7)
VRRALIAFLMFFCTQTALRAQSDCLEIAQPAVLVDSPLAAARWWVSAEYLFWWIKSDHTPGPLVTTGPAGNPGAGVRGNAATGVLFDGTYLEHKLDSGTRLGIGYWFDTEPSLGVEASGFVMETHTIHGKADSNRTDGSPVIARPFINALTGQQEAQIITSPQDALGGRYLGGIDVFSDSRTWGGEMNLLTRLGFVGAGTWDLLGGFRYLGQKDELRFSQSSTVLTPGTVGFLGTPAPAPDIVSIRDYTETHNDFYGAQVGARGSYVYGPWSLDLVGKAGLGATQQDLYVSGYTLLTDSTGKSLNAPGGLYNLPTNIGHFTRTQISFVSEADVRINYQITKRLKAQFGYTFMYWTNVVRPGEQINLSLDPRQIPSNLAYNPAIQATQPGPRMQSTDFWAQGLTFGFEFDF